MRKIIFLTIIVMGFFTCAALAMDPLQADPEMYKLKFENDRVRVMEVTFQPGQSIPEHSHPDHFVFVEQGGQLKITKSDGSIMDADLKAGDVVWIDSETHSAVNTGSSEVKLLVTELK
jgi:quercetin dioxygenase-like cupin family protein